MSRNFACRLSGEVASPSGAAAAALRARAAQWEMPILETADRLVWSLWGGELRLIPERDSLRIELHGPERRQIGLLQDMVSEALAEAGLGVAWDHVDVGALAPGLAVMRVASVRRLSPGFLRIRLSGPEAGRFGQGGLHFRLLLPPPGRVPVWPRIGPTGRTIWPEAADALHRPVYTVAAQQGDWLDFDIYRHPGSPTCDWAMSGIEGSDVAIMGPGGGWLPEAPQILLFGDQTALPAIRRIMQLQPLCAPESRILGAWLRVDSADLVGLASDPRITAVPDLLGALRAAPLPEAAHVWFAGHADDARQARDELTARGLGRKSVTAAAYWS
ncbi:siderophore-interacting protein [Paracoccus sp. (in: a-proteobacteria)]|uniref:siderophore-interacting protein n=1 Tax=Paracoccus sp. TaxID=267 RepID=UPI00272B0FE4|nr:siderophore-interacting protein [Paracoccus sp. (in: a-proteobacteria)]